MIAKPLHLMTERNAQFRWTTERQRAFNKLKSCLVSAPTLVFPDFTRPLILDTDASDVRIGAVLSQIHDDGLEHVVSYASHVLRKPEWNWYTPFFLMFGRQARLPLDLMTGTGGIKDRSYGEHAQNLKDSLQDAYDIVRNTAGMQQQ